MRIWKMLLMASLLCVVVISSFGCGSESDSLVPQSQVVAVQRGNLIVDITAVGNLALSVKEDLAFEISGTVEEVLVEEGDTIEQRQVLTKLDSTSLEQTVETAEIAVKTKELDLSLADQTIISAEIDLESAIGNFDEIRLPYAYTSFTFLYDMPEAESAIDDAERLLEEAKEGLKAEPGSDQYVEAWDKFEQALENLAYAKERLSRSQGEDRFIQYTQWARDYWTLLDAKQAIEKAELALSRAGDNQEKAILALDSASKDLDRAKESLGDAIIYAPFAGFITTVNVEGGDEVMKGTVAVQLADPNKFEADVLVSEMDILQVELGGESWVQVDAMPGLSLPAKVTHISPTATIQSGVVNYKVKVEVQSLEAVMQERQEAMQDTSSGEFTERIKQAVEEGLMTKEQAEEMIKQMQQAQGGQQAQVPTMIAEDFQLREGLTVTVSIIVDERHNVLLVPNSAITTQGRQTFVQVLAADGTLEQRAIQTGISDYQFTEVTEGLSEGEQVAVPQGTATVPTTQQQGGSHIRIPGMGGMGR